MTAAKLKTELFQLRLTPTEKEQLKILAAKSEKSASDWIRWMIDREFSKLK